MTKKILEENFKILFELISREQEQIYLEHKQSNSYDYILKKLNPD